MKKLKKFLSVILVLCTLITTTLACPTVIIAANGIQTKIDTIKSVYPTGSYFTASGGACYDWGGADCQLSNIPARGGLPSGSSVAAIVGDGWSCNGFARYCFYYIFGKSYGSCPQVSSNSLSIGDLIHVTSSSYGNHYAIFLYEDANNWYVYDSNGTRPVACNVAEHALSKSVYTFQTAYHAANYNEVNGVHTHSYVDGVCSCGDSVVPSKPALKNMQKVYLDNEPITFAWTATSNTTHYNFYAYNPQTGEHQDYKLSIAGTSTTMSLPKGEYVAIIQSWNSNYWNSSHTSWLYTEGDRISFQVVCSHTNATVTSVVEATCTEGGYSTYSCPDCGETYEGNSIGALGHNYDAVNIDATCTENGYVRYTCTRCGDTYDEIPGEWSEWSTETPPAVAVETEEKTQYRYQTKETSFFVNDSVSGWTKTGNTKDEYGAYGSWSGWTTGSMSATDTREVQTATVYKWYAYICPSCNTHDPFVGACSGCGYNLTGNNWYEMWSDISWSSGASSVSDNGVQKTKYTFDCGKLYSENINSSPTSGYRYRTRTKTTYNEFYRWSAWSDWQDAAVTASSTKNIETRTVYRYKIYDNTATGHNYYETVTYPTCTADGYTEYTCTVCGDTYTEIIPATGHDYTANVTDPTCKTKGYTTYTCENCGDRYVADYVSAYGHDFVDGKCSRCGKESIISITFNDITIIEGDSTISNSDGQKYYYPTPNLTVEYSSGEQVTGSIYELDLSDEIEWENGGHLWSIGSYECRAVYNGVTYTYTATVIEYPILSIEIEDIYIIENTNCTFVKNDLGEDVPIYNLSDITTMLTMYYKDGTVLSGTANEIYEKTGRSPIFSTLNHQYANPWQVGNTYECYVYYLGRSFNYNIHIVPEDYVICRHTNVDSSDTYVPATCTTDGYTGDVKCVDCGAVISCGETVPAIGHSYDNDCDADCNVCGEVRAVTHSYEAVVTAPTCLENGFTVHTCANCGDSYTDNITSALGHSLAETVVAPTTSAGGYTLHECTRPGCGYNYKDNYTDPIVDIETAPKIVVENKTVRAGETFTVNVSVENNPGINTFSLGIEYNKDLFTLDKVECNSALNGQFVFSKKAVWISGQDTQYNGTVLTLTFTAKEDAAAGQETVTVSYAAGDICNYDEEDVNFLVIPGEVEIVDYIAGDINGDGAVNSKDLTRLMKYLAGDDVTVVEKALDTNGDGAVNNKDLTRLLRYLAGDDVVIH